MIIGAYGYIIDTKYISQIQKYYPNLKIFNNTVLNRSFVVYPNKYYQLKDNDIIQIDINSLSLYGDQLEQLRKPFNQESPKLYLFTADTEIEHNISPDKLRIITFNIAYGVQYNKVQGSEKLLVELCQSVYNSDDPKTKGLSHIKGLSQCTLNAAEWLAAQNADLIGLQEVAHPQYVQKMLTVFPPGYESIGQQTTYFIYNKNKLGTGQILSPDNLAIYQKGRPMVIVWFSKVKLLAINLHAAHRIKLKQVIEQTFNTVNIPPTIKPDRIILTGDFNDTYNSPLTELKLMGKILKQHGPPPKSCCIDIDTKYQYYGDYIFDSNYKQPGFYGVPDDAKTPVLYNGNTPYINSNSNNKLMSDHEPVVFYPI